MASSSITPPAGFVLENQPAQNQPPSNQNTITPPAGFQLEGQSQNQNGIQSQGDLIGKSEDVAADVGKGFLKGAGQTVNTLSKGISKFAPSVIHPADLQGLEQMETPTNTAQKVGVVGEGIGEFFLGDEALKGLSLAERLGLATKVVKLAESHPFVGKMITAGMNAIRSGAVGGLQGLAHGETAGEALKTGAFTAGTTGVLESAGNVIKSLAPTTEKIAGTEVPVRASAHSSVADAAEGASRSKPLQKFDVEQTQPGARKAIGSIATDVRNTAPKFANGTDTQAFQDAVKEIAPGKSFTDLKPAEQSQVLQKAQAPKTARNGLSVASKAADFGDAADQVRSVAKPTYEKLDLLTKGQDMTFSDLQRAERSAFNKGDFDAVTKYQREQDKVFESYKDQFSDPDAYQNARRMWRQASALDKVHDTITSKGVMESTPNGLIPKGIPDPRYIKGKQFTDTILHLRDTGLLKDAGLLPQHIQDLQDIGRLLRKSGEIQNTNQLMKALKVGTKIAVGGPATAGAGWGASALLSKIMTDADAAAKAVKVLQSSTIPAATANIYRQLAPALSGPATAQQ